MIDLSRRWNGRWNGEVRGFKNPGEILSLPPSGYFELPTSSLSRPWC